MIKRGKLYVSKEDILSRVNEFDLVNYYFGISKVPIKVISPLRDESHPSFGFYINNGKLRWKDFTLNESGDIFDLLQKAWHMSYTDMLERIYLDLNLYTKSPINHISYNSNCKVERTTRVGCRVRAWYKYDIDYWKTYGISYPWLLYADIYPVDRVIVEKELHKSAFKTDRFAYAFIERKEGRVTMKVYQPYSQEYKWINGNDKSVISLWTKVPDKGDKIVICSSVKDALCLSANIHLPAIAVQGEGYSISKTACNELKRRFKQVYICFDNDAPGLADGIKLSQSTGFTNIILPQLGAKDISDLYKLKGESSFKNIMSPLFDNK